MIINKKVLLRERKRHTARRVTSTPSAVLTRGGTPSQVQIQTGGTPSQVQVQTVGYPHPLDGGYPHPALDVGYPLPGQGRYLHPALDGGDVGTPHPMMGVPPPRPVMGKVIVSLCVSVHTHPQGCELTHKVKLLPSPSFGCGR